MKVKFCKTEVEYPGDKLGELRDSGHLLDNMDELKARIKQDGYLLLRNFIAPETVLTAREAIVKYLDDKQSTCRRRAIDGSCYAQVGQRGENDRAECHYTSSVIACSF